MNRSSRMKVENRVPLTNSKVGSLASSAMPKKRPGTDCVGEIPSTSRLRSALDKARASTIIDGG